jgi:hypothetical protein
MRRARFQAAPSTPEAAGRPQLAATLASLGRIEVLRAIRSSRNPDRALTAEALLLEEVLCRR